MTMAGTVRSGAGGESHQTTEENPSRAVPGRPLVFMFPGQSSRDAKAIERLAAASSRCGEILANACDILGRDLRHHYRTDNPDIFRTNRDVQIGVFVANRLYAELLDECGVVSDLSLGLSLGEYNHVVEIGALSWNDALRLVDARGAAYDAGPEGAMAVLSPASEEDIRALLTRIRDVGFAEISNHNSPTQFVIAGTREAVDAALAIAEDEFFLQGVVIESRIPMHCRLFAPVAEMFRPRLAQEAWRATPGPYIANVTAEIIDHPSAATFVDYLSRHVCEAVLWRQSIEAVAARYPESVFIEVGPRSVLFNLLHPRWIAHRKFKTDDEQDPLRQAENIARELREPTHA
jgi:[acyl-carrier-protein] S-malonyltransferase